MRDIKVLAAKRFMKLPKTWYEMDEVERKLRIKQLWGKARMFVNMRKAISSIQNRVE